MAHVLADAAVVAANVARDKVTSTLIVTTATMPWWWSVLRAASDNAAMFAPIILLGAALLKFRNEWQKSRPRVLDKKRALNKAAASALTAAAKPSLKRYVIAAAAALAAVAAFLFVFRSEAKATPAPAAATTARRRRSSDHAGDEGDAEDDTSGAAPPWLVKARSVLGTTEKTASGAANKDVRDMFLAVEGYSRRDASGKLVATADPRKVPWCAVFVNWALEGSKPGTRSAQARSFGRDRRFERLSEPRLGCIVTMWRPPHNDGTHGHVGFFIRDNGSTIDVLGGNQGDSVKVATFSKKYLKGSPDLGYWWPRGAMAARTNRAAVATAAAGAGGGGAIVAAEMTTPDVPVVAPPAALEHIDTAKQVLTPIQDGLSVFPRTEKIAMMIGLALVALTIAGSLYVLWRNSEDWRNRPPQPG